MLNFVRKSDTIELRAIKLFETSSGQLMAWTTDGNIARFNPDGGHPLWEFLPDVKVIDVDVKAETVAALLADGQILIFNSRSKQVRKVFRVSKPVDEFNSPLNVKLSPDGKTVATIDRDVRLRAWEIDSGRAFPPTKLAGVWRAKVTDVREGGKAFLCEGTAGQAKVEMVGFTVDYEASKRSEEIAGASQLKFMKSGSLVGVKDDSVMWHQKDATRSVDLGSRVWSFSLNADESKAVVSMPGGGPWLGGRTAIVDLKAGRFVRDLQHPDAPMRAVCWLNDLAIVGGNKGAIYVYKEESRPIASLLGPEEDVAQFLVTFSYLYAVDESGICHRWPRKDVSDLAK